MKRRHGWQAEVGAAEMDGMGNEWYGNDEAGMDRTGRTDERK